MASIAVMLADGFEPLEAVAPVDALRRGGVEVALVSVMDTLEVTSAHNIVFRADERVEDIDLMRYDGIFIPGGSVGVENLMKCQAVSDALPGFVNDDARWVLSICAGPMVLNNLNLLAGRTATCYPGCEVGFPAGTYPGQGVCRDGNLITASGPGYALELGIEALRAIAGDKTADDVAAGMLVH